jgi:hypothetical protein
MRTCRYRIGRWLVHFGLWIMPSGRARTELYTLFSRWGRDVISEVAAQKPVSQ